MRSTAAVTRQAEPGIRGATICLWLVAALLVELELVWFVFDRMYAS